ncbi:MauE/DoxX family redox-associated membrane protein [Aliivibrio kagoshimensis]|uniref:MauE/DoxX family redox-associated membrane protein n=1 Tax=Aliivibrio kagoshimensis TaxID=2910230 RepID=UPI003D0AA11A
MDRESIFYHINRCLLIFTAASIALKGLLQPEYFALLLQDTGLVSTMMSKPITSLLSLTLVALVVGYLTKKVSLIPLLAAITIYLSVIGLALFQGLNIDCDCYQLGSIESTVYGNIAPQFLVILTLTFATALPILFCKRK